MKVTYLGTCVYLIPVDGKIEWEKCGEYAVCTVLDADSSTVLLCQEHLTLVEKMFDLYCEEK